MKQPDDEKYRYCSCGEPDCAREEAMNETEHEYLKPNIPSAHQTQFPVRVCVELSSAVAVAELHRLLADNETDNAADAIERALIFCSTDQTE